MQTVTKTCPVCEQTFLGVSQRKYCSPPCSALAQLRNSDKAREERKRGRVVIESCCLTCEKQFTAAASKRFCSPMCRAVYDVQPSVCRERLVRLLIREREK